MKLLTAIKGFTKKINQIKNKIENEKLTQEFDNELLNRKRHNIELTLFVLTNYVLIDMAQNTGLIYRRNDPFIVTEVQRLFWEWKKEGIINEFDDFEDTTKNWIMAYAKI